MKISTKRSFKAIKEKYRSSAISAYSGQTAFFMILSFFPFLLFFFSLLNLTPLKEEDFLKWAFTFIPETFQEVMYGFSEEIYSGSPSGRISITVVTAIWLSSKAFLSLQQGLNSMYERKESRNYILLRIYAILYSIVFALMLIVMLALLVFGNKIRHILFKDITFINHIVDVRIWLCFPVLFLFFWLIYCFLPNTKQRIKAQIPGALFSAAGWIIFSELFSIYVDRYSNYDSFYGTMTSIALIMVWLYGCIYVIFLGGIINSVIECKK